MVSGMEVIGRMKEISTKWTFDYTPSWRTSFDENLELSYSVTENLWLIRKWERGEGENLNTGHSKNIFYPNPFVKILNYPNSCGPHTRYNSISNGNTYNLHRSPCLFLKLTIKNGKSIHFCVLNATTLA